MISRNARRMTLAVMLTCATTLTVAAPVKYTVDPAHTYPSFEADHMGGLSVWRGKFNATSGTVTLDKEGKSGEIDIRIDASSIDFGHEKMNTHAKSADMLDTTSFPEATYTGKLAAFSNGAPTEVDGTLTLHGVAKPVKLKIDKFLCKPKPTTKQEVCGANATGKINREDFGISFGKAFGFNMEVALQIQIEAGKAE